MSETLVLNSSYQLTYLPRSFSSFIFLSFLFTNPTSSFSFPLLPSDLGTVQATPCNMRLRPRDFISLFSLPAHNSVQKWKPLQFSLLDSRWSELNLSFPFSSLSCLSIYYLQSLVLTRLLQKLFGLGRNIST